LPRTLIKHNQMSNVEDQHITPKRRLIYIFLLISTSMQTPICLKIPIKKKSFKLYSTK